MVKMNSQFGYANKYMYDNKGKDLKWFPMDTERRFKSNQDSNYNYPLPRQDRLRELGWLDTPIEYKISKYGFRHNGEKEQTGGVMWVGSSDVFGVGNHYENNYTLIAHSMAYSHLPYYNLGCAGFGIETFYRVIRYNIERLKPTILVMLKPWVETRTETWCKDTFVIDQHYINPKEEIQSILCYFKNMDAIRYLCHRHNVKFIYKGKTMFKYTRDYRDDKWKTARDLYHNGAEWNNIAGILLGDNLHETDIVD